MLAHLSQIFPIPCRRDTFPRRIGSRLIRARRDALLAQLAHVPVLFVRHVPEFDRVVWMKIGTLESLRMEKPITKDARPFRRLRPELMHHDIIWMHAEQHVWENGIIENPVELLGAHVAHGQRAGITAHSETVAFRNPHKSAE